MTAEHQTLSCVADDAVRGWRLDQFLARIAPDFSRSRWQTSIKAGLVRLNGNVARAKDQVFPGDHISAQIAVEAENDAQSQDIPLTVVHADADIIRYRQPAGLVVPSGRG